MYQALSMRISSEIVGNPDEPLPYLYSDSVLNSLSFEILSRNEKTGVAKVRFHYVDTLALADQISGSITVADEFYTACIEAIHTQTAPMAEAEIQVSFEQREINGQWMLWPVDDLALADVLSGGAASAFKALTEKQA